MYCISISPPDAERCLEQLSSAPMVELRGDLCRLSSDELRRVVCAHPNLLYTCHLEELDPKWAEEQYAVAIAGGAKLVDVEIDAPDWLVERVKSLVEGTDVKLLISYHNYTLTPSLEELSEVVEKCLSMGAHIVKVATTATDAQDAITLGKLYRRYPQLAGRLVAFAMGREGVCTRRLSLIEGAPFTFVAPDGGAATAPGQMTHSELKNLMESGTSLSQISIPHKATPTGSKSYFQRAIVAATIAEGTSRLSYSGSLCGDTRAALGWARSLGAEVEVSDTQITIQGVGRNGLAAAQGHTFDVGESALLARLTMGLVAMVGSGATIVGHGTLPGRSFEADIAILNSLGVEVESNNNHLPLTIKGGVRTNTIAVEACHSSQLISGLLMGAPLREQSCKIEIAKPTSKPYLDMTLNVMLLFGIDYGAGYGLEADGSEPLTFVVSEEEKYLGRDIFIEADWSSAGYLLAAAAIAQSGFAPRPEGYVVGGMNMRSNQADRIILHKLIASGCNVEFVDTDAVEMEFDGTRQAVQEICDIVLLPSEGLAPIVCDATHAPDAIPTLAILGLFANGESRIGGLGRLLNKESNRRSALVAELLALGADIDIEGDELVVRGGKPLRGASLCAHNDHRMAMALAVAALFIEEPCTLDSLDCVAKSWPSFWEVFGLNK